MDNIEKIFRSREITSLTFVIVMFLGVGLVNPSFLAPKNILLCLNGSVVFTMLAVGIAFVIITGEIDVSIGAVMGFSATVSATMLRDGLPWGLAIGAAALIGILAGIVNGFGVVTLKVPSIIMTLGLNGVIRGLCYVYTDGKWVENLPYEYKQLSQATVGGVTCFYLIAIVIMLAVHLILTRTKRGRYFVAVGDNIGGATLIGIPVKATKFTSFVLCSFFAALAGLMYVSRIGFVTPTAGNGYEMKAIAACVLGGVSLSGGIGSVVGAAIGAIIMASIGRILVFLQFSSDYDNTITGILLITIVAADALLQSRAAEKARRQRLAARISNPAGRMEGGVRDEP